MEEIENIGKAFDAFKAQADEIIKLMHEREKREQRMKEKPRKFLITIPPLEEDADIPDEGDFTLTDSLRWLMHDGTATETNHNTIHIEEIFDEQD